MLNIEASLTVAGCDLRYWDTGGDGTPVVFSHGAGADQLMFRSQAEHLARHGYRVVTWDLRGHGRSRPGGAPFTAERAAGDLVALLDHLELARPVLAGQSLGGNLAQAVVRRRPGLARGLIVMDSTCNTGPLSRAERVLLSAALPTLSVIPARRLPALMANASAATEQGRAYARRAFEQLPKREFLAVWRATVELVDPDPAYRTPVPLCLIRGERDRTGNIATAMPRWARTEGVQETVIPDAGHLVTLDAPDAVNSAILAFLRTELES
ncbi:alpha/beta fold hydrolase [Nonomuraea cavernae]|uniref:Alpha/beta hydrolase n=1 Tax=Nonomuraea cavernae TaxID=2045107 RepID=A0A917ZEY6_9ACTN|nr:alpha/beta hydrolase [Nonomuraea cavernae]MCA2189565.1 alpha/beta hydrolase [Nonomuraea cavernae]GGO81593.1 alpha/beta hydrolase [Nonomuraea cavernae]